MTYRDTLDEISRVQYDNAMARAAAAERHAAPPRNAIVDAAGFGRLTQSDLDGFAGIEGDPNDARIFHDLEVLDGREAVLVLCDEHLGLYYADENEDLHGFQVSGVARMVRELIAAELAKWTERHPGVRITDDVLDRLGFESVF